MSNISKVPCIRPLQFLTERRNQTLGQAAIKFILSEPSIITVLPNIYNMEQINEFDDEDLPKIAELKEVNFGVDEEPMKMKGDPMSSLDAWEKELAVAS